MRNLQRKVKLTKQQVQRLENKLKKLIETEGNVLKEKDAADMEKVFADVSSRIDKEFAEDSPQRILWEQQKKHNSLANKKQMRWHPLVIRFTLNLKYLSSSAYKAVPQSGFLNLSS